MSRWEQAAFVVTGLIAIALIAYGSYRVHQVDIAAPCSDYRDTPIRNVPLRCFPTKP